jgi:hypothetical protein
VRLAPTNRQGQLKNDVFFEHAMRFSEIRKKHDRVYAEWFTRADRKAVEGVGGGGDGLRLADGSYDPAMRTQRVGGGACAVLPDAGQARSRSLLLPLPSSDSDPNAGS